MKKYLAQYLKLSDRQIEKVISVVGLAAVIIVAYFIISLSVDVHYIKSDLASTTDSLAGQIANLQADLATTTKDNQLLFAQLANQQNQNVNLGQTLSGIANTVGTLEKLSKTDRELLQKYSKVYFLSENYVPIQLTNIDQRYLQDKNKTMQFHSVALPFLTNMLDNAGSSGVTIQVASAYRSFGTQATLKSNYLVTYGTGANKFSAEQGYSEHQLGTAVDLSTPDPADSLLAISFDQTPAFNWLVNNAYRYGFILSYPKGNTYYQYEPWHWRFVGTQLATYLHNQNKNFYDLDQRQLDTYLADIFS